MSQNELKRPAQFKRAAVQNEKVGRVYQAISFYEKYLEKKSNFKVKTKLVKLYYDVREYEKADLLIKSIEEEKKAEEPMLVYYQAKILMINGEYELAKSLLAQFKKLNKGAKNEKEYKKLIKAASEGCDSAQFIIQRPIPYQVYSLKGEVNGDHIDFNPSFANDSMFYYSSLRAKDIDYRNIPDSVDYPRRKIYRASVNRETKEVIFGGEVVELLDEEFDLSAGKFSEDGKRYYFSKCQMNMTGQVICQLYYMEKDNKQWSQPMALPEIVNNPKFSNSHPTIGVHPKTGNDLIYFVSNRPEGVGGQDIWVTEYKVSKKVFKPVKNAGKKINTPGDEVTPWVHEGKLYFSSDGHYGLGGLDIFEATGYLKMWKDVKNIGFPINSSADELGYEINESVVTLTSNRIQFENTSGALCCDDIYVFKVGEKPTHKLIIAQDSTYTDSLYTIKLYKPGDEGMELVSKFHISEKEKLFKLDPELGYELVVEEPGYLAQKYTVNPKDFKSDTLHLTHKREPLPTEAIILKNINYEFDSAQLTDSSLYNIDKYLLPLLENNPDIRIELGSHTDSKGQEAYNKKLSQRRAESVVNYLIKKGIDKDRLVPVGYGESKPIAPNENEDGSDNPEGRAMNRRTEFKIIQ